MLEARDITKVYRSGAGDVMPLKGVNVDLMAGELTLLMGPSGSGKTTLLSILGCILSPTSGTVRLAGQTINDKSAEELAELRRKYIGFVFQSYNLFPTLTALENVRIALDVRGEAAGEARRRAEEALKEVSLGHHLSQPAVGEPEEVAVGQRQPREQHEAEEEEPRPPRPTADDRGRFCDFRGIHQGVPSGGAGGGAG